MTGLEKYRQKFPHATDVDYQKACKQVQTKSISGTTYTYAESGELIPVKSIARMMTEDGGYEQRAER